jgi:hypothetical protein
MSKLISLLVIASLCLSFPRDRPQIEGGVHSSVLTGIDVLERQRFTVLTELSARHGGRLRLGLMTNQTGLDAARRRTVDILFQDAARQVPGLTMTTLFSMG